MKRVTITHVPARDDQPARVRVAYRAREDSEASEREVPFAFETTEEERSLIQWYVEDYLTYPWGEFRARAQRAEELMADLGVRLFDAVFGAPETQALYANVRHALAETRIVVHAASAEGVALPWELMRDGQLGALGDLATRAHAFVRSQPNLTELRATLPDEGDTFNILLVICRPDGPRDVPFQSVARRLLEVFRPHRHRIRIDVLRPPTLVQLQRVLAARPGFYHVLHFDGHGSAPRGGRTSGVYAGDIGASGDAQGVLLFEDDGARARPVTGEELGRALADAGVPAVLLNACQSGMTRPEVAYPSVGNQLLQAGAAGVVAMAYSVTVSAAGDFMAELYEQLVAGEELGRAVARARQTLRAQPDRPSPLGPTPLADWIVPVLFESAPVRLGRAPQSPEHLTLTRPQDRQERVGAEVGCPEPPAFGFVGRDAVILDLERAFRSETIVLLRGMAGVGKTEAAVGFGRWLSETGGLSGPIFFFSFEQYLPLAHVCDAVGRVFERQIKEQARQEWHLLDAGQRRELALGILRQVPCLLIWDNFEPVPGFPTGTPSDWFDEEERRDLRDFLVALRGGKTKVLLTSRRDEPWLGPIYRGIELRGLPLTEAQELAVRVLTRAGLDPRELRQLPAYNDLLTYLQGNPLAIQVILPELARTRKPDELLEALRRGEANLVGDDAEQGRTRSLHASLDYRFAAFDEKTRQRLGVLALFHGFVDADLLALLCRQENAPDLWRGLTKDDWLPLLDAAAEVGLLRALGGGCYTMHPALPWFLHRLLLDALPIHVGWLERALPSVYGKYALALARFVETQADLVLTLLRAEESNLRQALRLARRDGLYDAVKGVLHGLNVLLTTGGRWMEWERLLMALEAEVTDGGEQPLPGREALWRALLVHRQELAGFRRDPAAQEAILLNLLHYYAAEGHDEDHSATLHQLGRVAELRGQLDEAERRYTESLTISDRAGDEHGQAVTLHQLGINAHLRGLLDEAESRYRKSLAIKERLGDERGLASTLHQLGAVAQDRSRLEEAESLYRQSLAISARLGDERGLASTLHHLGTVALIRGRFDEAEDFYKESLAVKERLGDEHGQAISLHQVGRVAQFRGRLAEAERWYRHNFEIAERLRDESLQATTLHQLGTVAHEMGQFAEAERWYQRALEIAERLGDEQGQTTTLGQLSIVALQGQRFAEAERWYQRALEIAERLGDDHGRASILHQLGVVALQEERLAEAEQRFEESLAIKDRLNDDRIQVSTLYQLGMLAERRGNLTDALSLYRKAEAKATLLDTPNVHEVILSSLERVSRNASEDREPAN